jgi:RNA polymerase sigma-70 factor (ECF subfamily)
VGADLRPFTSLAEDRPVTIQPLRIDAPQAALHGWSAAMQAASDEALITRIAAGDKLAMQVLFARHHVRVYRFVLRVVRDQGAAEDLISEVFLEVWRQAAKFRARAAVSTWLLAIARFKALSSLRRREEEELDDETAATIEDTGDDPEITIRKKDRSEILRKCLARLSPDHREIVDLVYYQEKAISEVAEIVGAPENTVKTRMFYARKRLSELLNTAGVEGILP